MMGPILRAGSFVALGNLVQGISRRNAHEAFAQCIGLTKAFATLKDNEAVWSTKARKELKDKDPSTLVYQTPDVSGLPRHAPR